jgi:hypothetical protein
MGPSNDTSMRATRLVHLIHLHYITVINVCLKGRIKHPTPSPNYAISQVLLLLILSLNPDILPSAAFYSFT